MNTLEKILSMWKEDSHIDPLKLDEISALTPMHHAKYLAILSTAKQKKKKVYHEQQNLLKDKWLWYNGKLSQAEIEALGWDYDALNGLKILKGDMDYYYNSDPEIQKSEEKLEYWKNVVETLDEIIQNLRWRHATIKNIIEFKKFEAGY
jgi:hypothetical protein